MIPGLRSTRAKAIAVVVVLAVVGSSVFWAVRAWQASRPVVSLTTVTRARITDSVVAVGDIKSGKQNTITLSPSVKVVNVHVREGQRVARGDVLVTLDTSEYARQLEQQGITLSDAESMLRFLSGPNAEMNNASAGNTVNQASIALDNALAAAEAARQHLADVPGLNDNALRQAEIALERARLSAEAARVNLDSTRALNENAICQARLALDAARDAKREAEYDLADLKAKLQAGLITQAEYDAQYPLLRSALTNAENAYWSAQVSLDTTLVSADAANERAVQAVREADLAVASAEAALDAVAQQADSQLQAAQRTVGDAQRAVNSAEVALSNALTAAGFARASDDQRVASQSSQIDQVEATIAHLLGKIDQGKLRAAVDGVVSRVDAESGQYPQLGDVVVVEGTSGYLASLDLDQADSAGITTGQRASITLKGIGATFQGSVASVAPIAQRSATSADRDPKVTIEVSILDPDATIRIGFEADVEIFRDDKPSVLEVGLDAVRSEPGTGRRYVFVVDDHNLVTRVFISTGIESGDRVEVLSGLAEGQDCVLNPPDNLVDGMTVRIAGGGR